MADKVKITVIIPVYNVESYIERCLESVINQSFSDIEIICIDDKSTDNSLHIVKHYCQKDKRIRYFANEINKGLSFARNVGIREAIGEYIIFLDSDDAIVEGSLEKLYDIAKTSNYQMIFFDFVNKYESDQLRKTLKYIDRDRKNLNGEWCGADLFIKMVDDFDMQPQAGVKLYSRIFLLSNNLFFHEGMLHEDIPFAVKAMIIAKRVYFIGNKLYEWWHREASITTAQTSAAHIEGRIKGIIDIIEFAAQIKVDLKVQRAIEKYVVSLINVTKQKLTLLDNKNFIFSNELRYRLFLDMIIYPKEKRISMSQKTRILGAENVFIYGAGLVAQIVVEEISHYNIGICGVIVTKLQDKKFFYGHKIEEAEAIPECMKGNLVIVATAQNSYREIGCNLKRLGFENVEYVELEG